MNKIFSKSVDAFWFGQGHNACDSNWVVSDSDLNRVMKFSTTSENVVFLPNTLREALQLELGSCISERDVDAIVKDHNITLNTPDCVFYFDKASQAELMNFKDSNTRILTPKDQEAFDDFNRRTSPEDLDDAYVELDHWLVAGYFEGETLVAIASMYPWFEGSLLCDTGVVSSPESRGKGYGKKLVQFISKEALQQGYEPQYRCQFDNHASKGLAQSIGMSLIGMVAIGS